VLAGAGDENFTVRSMAQFAIGNFAQSLSGAQVGQALSREMYRRLCDATVAGLGDANEKVRVLVCGGSGQNLGPILCARFASFRFGRPFSALAWPASLHFSQVVSSAIRAAGLVLQLGDTGDVLELRQERARFVDVVVGDLNNKIELALDQNSNRALLRHLNSRQRYSVSKHAWGACSALANVGVVECNKQASVFLLSRCLVDAANVKIRSAAAGTLMEVLHK
jgi:hypothetical protein